MANKDFAPPPGAMLSPAFPRPLGGLPAADLSDDEWAMLKESERIAPAEEAPHAGGFKLRRAGVLEVRPPAWLVRDLLEADCLALLFGDPAAGKSFFALDLAACIATGAAFHGRAVARPGSVVYIAGEGHNGLARRLRAWSIARGVSLLEAPLSVSTLPAALCDPGTMGEVERAVARSVREIGVPRLIVLDTWSRNIGGDENSSADTALAVAALDRLRAPWRAAGLAVHHVGHGEKARARGSTVLRGAVDLELKVERGGDGLVRVECTKAKDIAPPSPMAFKLCDVDLGIVDEDGRPVGSAVLAEEDYRPEEAPRAPSGKHQKAALAILETELERHRKNVQASGRDRAGARVTVDAWRDACAIAGIDRRRFSEARTSLLLSGAIEVQGGFVSIPCPSEIVRRPPPIGGADTDGQKAEKKPDGKRTKTGQAPDGCGERVVGLSAAGLERLAEIREELRSPPDWTPEEAMAKAAELAETVLERAALRRLAAEAPPLPESGRPPSQSWEGLAETMSPGHSAIPAATTAIPAASEEEELGIF